MTSGPHASGARPVFEARAVSKVYRQGVITVEAVTDVDLSIAAGEFVVLAGPSGSGKTTLLNLMGGLDRPDRGSLWFEGTDLGAGTEAQRIALRRNRLGFIFQAFNLVPVLSAYENVEYALWLTGRPRAERRVRVQNALADVGLANRSAHRPDHLSGGERQRVALARALVHDPIAILADEPTASLDSKTGAEVLALFRELNASRGTTFLVATHDPAIVASAPRVVRLTDGRLASDSGGGAR
jgi:putative ABC transport system ATP-binding protein